MVFIMEMKYTKEDIKKALEQAEANMNFEEVIIQENTLENSKQKVLRKDFNNESNRRSN